MARILFVVPPLEGHVNPTVSVAQCLVNRGHEVAWTGHPTAVRPLLPEGAALIPLDDRVPSELLKDKWERARVRGLERLKFLYEDFFLPLARSMIPGVDAAAAQFHPDVIVSDQQTVAGGLVARRRGLSWATSVTTSAGVVEMIPILPRVGAWVTERLAELQRETGVPVVDHPGISPHLVVVFSSSAMLGDRQFPPQFHFVGPSLGRRPLAAMFPWEWLNPNKQKILVTLGTVNVSEGGRFFDAVVEAMGNRCEQVIMVAPESLTSCPMPENILVRTRIPQLEVLPHVNAVVCHAGHNTVCEALAHGLPLVLTPIKDDQSVVAQQVVDAGAGIRLKFGRLSSREFLEAVQRVLGEASFREAAGRIRESFETAGGAERAAELIEKLA